MGGKYSEYQQYKRKPQRKRVVHPIWRGVGFVMMVLIPVIAWAGTDLVIRRNLVPLPRDLLARPGQFLYTLIPDPLLYIKITVFIVLVVSLFLIFMFISFLVTSAVIGPASRYDPYYVPPVRSTRKKEKK